MVNGIGVCADEFSIAASFVPGPNITTIVTVPILVGCKVVYPLLQEGKKNALGVLL